MTNRERLQENYEDALFALLMDDVARTEGKRLIRENEALQADPNAAVPENIDRRCMQLIQSQKARSTDLCRGCSCYNHCITFYQCICLFSKFPGQNTESVTGN